MIRMIELSNGDLVTVDQYKKQNKNIVFSVKFPPVDFLASRGERYVEVASTTKVSVVTMRQARLALLDAGLLSQIPVVIDQLEGDDKLRAEIEYGGSRVERNNPTMVSVLSALGQTEDDIDTLFLEASKK